MIETIIIRPAVRNRLHAGPFGPAWEGVAQALHDQGYLPSTIRAYLRTGVQFGEWVAHRRIPVTEIANATVAQYLQHCGRLPSGRLPKAALGLPRLVSLLREQGVIGPEPAPSQTECDRWLVRYAQYLRTVKGAAESTCDLYLRSGRRLLTHCFPTDQVNWEAVTAQQIVTFVQHETAHRTGLGRSGPAIAVRAALRFVVFSGERTTSLAEALPLPRHRMHATLPPQLTPP